VIVKLKRSSREDKSAYYVRGVLLKKRFTCFYRSIKPETESDGSTKIGGGRKYIRLSAMLEKRPDRMSARRKGNEFPTGKRNPKKGNLIAALFVAEGAIFIRPLLPTIKNTEWGQPSHFTGSVR